eukprot:5413139-Lingulodinium_polyedra.AAC.1
MQRPAVIVWVRQHGEQSFVVLGPPVFSPWRVAFDSMRSVGLGVCRRVIASVFARVDVCPT